MKTLNDYGQDVMDAQSRMESIDANIEKTEAALESLRTDHEKACAELALAKDALQAATDRVKSGDYGVEPEVSRAAVEAILNDDEPFEGINRAPPEDEPDYQLIDNRTLASNGAGF